MGRTKALIDVDGTPMGSLVLNALRSAGCDPVIVYGGQADELASLGVTVEPDLHPGDGPVGAVAGVLRLVSHARTTEAGTGEGNPSHCANGLPAVGLGAVDQVVVVACDLPDLDRAVIGSLISTAEQHRETVVVARTDRIEPLCALWPLSACEAVSEQFAAGVRALHRVIDSLDGVVVEVPFAALRNVNTPADLA